VQITEVRIRRVDGTGKTKAVASMTFDDRFVIHEVKVIEGQEGRLFISMPSRRLPGGDYLDIAHPITSDTRQYIQEEILKAYDQVVSLGQRELRTTVA